MEYSNSDNESSQASPSSFHDDDSYRSSKGGSNGKPKVHKCRTCGFSTTNKHESWLHIAIHMKPEKILRCPECPFVTEYKHHLDFHIWNHQGMKPYKCDKCPYVCVNKSMLKSHLKSHSNVYQYRCANCAYRTKYCHSLKIHLRKYRHEPGMVLDSEGNPNPNPVIDVYGNRRGPKQKSKKSDGNGHGHSHGHSHSHQPIQPAVPPLNAFQNFPWVNNVFFPDNSRIPCPTTLLPNAIINTPFAGIEPTKSTDISPSQETDNYNNNVKITNINNNSTSSNNNTLYNNHNDSGINVDNIKRDNSSDDEDVFQPDTCLEEPSSVSSPPPNYYMAFDKTPTSTTSQHIPENVADEAPLNLSVSHSVTTQHNEANSATPVVKNRRKGVACKLKRTYTTDDEDYPKNLTNSKSECRVETSTAPILEENPQTDHDSELDLLAKLKNKKTFFYCDFCEITFFNQIMFTMHMGYHGYSDPFTCNRCGKKTEDNIAFYAHMISSAHL